MVNIGINGFGRIGRMALRSVIELFGDKARVVAVNDLQDPEYLAYMLQYDSVHGKLPFQASIQNGRLTAGGQSARLFSCKDPSQIDWAGCGCDAVLECTGAFLTAEACQAHLQAGAKRVIMSAPPKDDTPMFVYGVNHLSYQGQSVISNASCTTNCLAPLALALHQNWGIRRGLMTTVHAATATQKTVDGPSHKDWRGGRGILENIIPSSTGAAKAVGKVIPELQGKLTGMSMRVPTSDVSVVDLTVELEKPASLQQIKERLQELSCTSMAGVLGYTDQAAVSTDFRHDPRTSIFDAGASMQLDPTFFKLISWYDNEWGYACKLIEMAAHISNA